MKNPMNILSAVAVVVAALTVLPACKATSNVEPATEPATQVASTQNESGYKWFAKKGQRRGAKKAEAPAPAAAAEPVDSSLQRVVVTGYCSCPVCCGPNAAGVTASGKKAQVGTIAADTSIFPFGTKLNIPGYGDGVVEDTGSRVKGYRIDVWFPTHEAAVKWGSREMFVAFPSAL